MKDIPNHQLPTPVRALLTDEPIELLKFAAEAFVEGQVAIATLVDIRGGAARALGSQVITSSDGRFAGYVSGGCVEAAVAAEALLAMADGCDRTVLFGDGSPFLDVVLPCGGGITVAIHVLREAAEIEKVLERLELRQATGLRYSPERQSLVLADAADRAGWAGDSFLAVYRPRTQIIISGQTTEVRSVARLAECSGFEVAVLAPGGGSHFIGEVVDPFSAILLLHHDLEQEIPVLQAALQTSCFYLGALGSRRTHRRRVDRLLRLGHGETELARIKAPIGLFGPARDSASLALSVLADVAASRLEAFGR
ncbi:XdhC family protein [Ensifer sp. ENS07]|uniref:XdhC family protein n=1 Tax=Ensifer sp. ENS07 TaxID=2769274 RepID=UPI00353012F5